MKQATEQSKPTRKRRPRKDAFRPYQNLCWQYGPNERMSSILVTVDQVVQGLLKLESRNPEWHSVLAVAQVLLCRLENIRLEVRDRASKAARALALDDLERVRQEVHALNQAVTTRECAERRPAFHGIKVTSDRKFHGLE